MRYDFYAYMDRMKYIKRWQLMRSVREENIMEHSQSVAMLAHALAVIKNERFGGSVDVLKTVTSKYSIPFLDMLQVGGMTPKVPIYQELYMQDGLHPNADGAFLIASMLAYVIGNRAY